MNNLKAKLLCAWMLTIVGLSLTALPLYSELFTKKPFKSETTEHGFSTSSTVSYTMMHVSPWTPFIGGLMALVGGVFVGRMQCRKDS